MKAAHVCLWHIAVASQSGVMSASGGRKHTRVGRGVGFDPISDMQRLFESTIVQLFTSRFAARAQHPNHIRPEAMP